MKIIRTMDITGVAPAAITSSNITNPETGTTTYSGGTTYALGDLVSVDTHNATVTITYASPSVVTWTAHELVVGDKIYFTTTGALPSNLTVNTLYYVVEILTVDTFKFASTEGGMPINTIKLGGSAGSGTNTGYVFVYGVFESLQASNTNHHPRKASSSAWWRRLRSTNMYQMFNGTVNQQTLSPSAIHVVLTVSRAVDTIVLLNIHVLQVQVTCTDTTLGVVHDVPYTTYENINGVSEYFEDLVVTDIPNFSSGTITLDINNGSYPLEAAACGQVLIGYAVDAGDTEYGASVGVQDFSVIEQNDFGDYDIVTRTNRKLGSFQIMVPNASRSRVYRILSQQKTKKTLYIGSDGISETAIYGFPGEWKMLIQYQHYSILNVDLLGLT